MRRGTFQCLVAAAAVLAASAAASRPFFDPRADRLDAIDADQAFAAEARDPACSAAKLVSTGGSAPRNPHTLAVRWTGYSNFELAYKGKIILLDAYFDRGGDYPPLGFAAADVTKADAILIGHGHFDHMSDAASVGIRTGAPIVAAPVTAQKLGTQAVPAAQIRIVTGTGGELLKFDGFTVEPILGRHGQPDRHITEVMGGALNALAPKLTPEQAAEERAIRARGTSDPRVIEEGTIAYLITLDDGFRIMFRDSRAATASRYALTPRSTSAIPAGEGPAGLGISGLGPKIPASRGVPGYRTVSRAGRRQRGGVRPPIGGKEPENADVAGPPRRVLSRRSNPPLSAAE
jgi:hypothetical protein